MAITKGAKKAIRSAARKKATNERRRRALRESAKLVREAITAGKGSKEALAAAYKAIDKATKRGLIKKNTAARKKSHVARTLGAKA